MGAKWTFFAPLALLAPQLALGCGAPVEEPAPAKASSSSYGLSGTYTPTRAGGASGIQMFVAEPGRRYRLRANGCAEDACEERGSYEIDAARSVMRLVLDETGASYAIALELGAAGGGRSGALTPREADEEEPQGLLDDDKNPLIVASCVSLLGESFGNGDTSCEGGGGGGERGPSTFRCNSATDCEGTADCRGRGDTENNTRFAASQQEVRFAQEMCRLRCPHFGNGSSNGIHGAAMTWVTNQSTGYTGYALEGSCDCSGSRDVPFYAHMSCQ